MWLMKKLAETKILWASFAATVVISIAFQVLIVMFGLVLLDSISDPEQARAAVANMSAHQRSIHAWMTVSLDVAYPVAYGALFIGSAYKFFPKIGFWLALPTIVVVPVDLIEGVVQVFALTDVTDWLGAKLILTSLKQVLLLAGMFITVCGWISWTAARVMGRNQQGS